MRSVNKIMTGEARMLTRRKWIAASTGSLLWGALGARTTSAIVTSKTPAEPLTRLPGKRALIRRTFRPPNFETPLSELRSAFTSNEAFFVRYHLARIPQIDARAWRLRVGGPSAARSVEFSLAELQQRFERVALPAVNQCSGNRRAFFSPRVPGVQWGNGAMGHATWSGVRLRDVLRSCGPRAGSLEVVFDGADGPLLPQTPDFQKSLPLERALDENTLIAFEMNGRSLPQLNGAPARLVVPGWTATYWVKHLTEVRVQAQPFDGFWMKSAYRIPTGAFPGERFASQESPETTPITQILVNSLVTAPAPGTRLPRHRPVELSGWAWDGGTGIAAVDISSDGGASWRPAALERDLGRFAWRGFRFPLDTSRAGALGVLVRATSRAGARQPQNLTANPGGYHDNRMLSLEWEVA